MSVKGNHRNKRHGNPRPIMTTTAPVLELLFCSINFFGAKCVDGTVSGHTGRDTNCFLPQVDDTQSHTNGSLNNNGIEFGVSSLQNEIRVIIQVTWIAHSFKKKWRLGSRTWTVGQNGEKKRLIVCLGNEQQQQQQRWSTPNGEAVSYQHRTETAVLTGGW